MPYKYFVPQQLTASEVNEYLMNQSVMVFDSVAARNSSLTAPTEGMVCYLKDSNQMFTYDGSTWVRIVVLSSAGAFDFASCITVITETSAGRGIGVRASSGDTTPPIIQFLNNAANTQLGTITAPSAGNISINSDRVQRNGASFINIVDLPSILIDEFQAPTNGSRTYSTATIPTTARYLYLDVFITANSSDHQNLELSNSSTTTAIKNWVDTRGQQPSTQFGNMTARRSVYMTYNGEADGYSPNYGMWYPGVIAPCAGNVLYWSMYGNSGSTPWVYLKILGYST